MTQKEEFKKALEILKKIEENIEVCCSVTMDPLDIKDLITKLRIAIHEYSKNNTK